MSVRTIGVIGAGIMGRCIAQIAATTGLNVTLVDVGERAVKNALDAVEGNLTRLVGKGKMTAAEKETALRLIHGTTAYEDLKTVDVVIEAATENFDTKVKILKQVDALVRAEAIIASNTSSISITKLASAVSHPDHVIGMHFFNPVPAMNLVEIARGLQTSDATHDAIEALALQLGKSPITVKSGPGFVVNRILLPMINEAFLCSPKGIPARRKSTKG